MSDLIRMNGWIRKLTGSGIVYYVKRKTGETRWDHPGLSAVVESLCRYDNIRYAAYRLSSKLLALTESLGVSRIPLNDLVKVVCQQGVVAPSIILDSQHIRDILHDLYGASDQRYSTLRANSTVLAEAMANLVEQLLDPAHQGGVTSLGLKTIMAVFCRARLREKLVFLFREHAHKGILSQTELTYMLSILSRIPEVLGEGVMFGSGVVGGAVDSALKVGGGRGLTEEAWLFWAGRDPAELVWLTTTYRLLSGQGIVHNLSCSACCQPIVGLRYQCLQCLGYDLCQACFFIGASSRGHRPKHPVQEYCFPSSRGDQFKAVMATIVNKIKPKSILKTKKKLTRRLTVDKHEGAALRNQFREKQGAYPEPPPLLAAEGGTLSRTDKSRKPMRKPVSRNVSPREEDEEHNYAAKRGDVVQELQESDITDSPIYDRISPSSSGFCSGSDSHSSEVRLKPVVSRELSSTSSASSDRDGRRREKPPRKSKSAKKLRNSTAKQEVLKSRESIAELEWDNAGTELNCLEHWNYPDNQAFEHSILRRDLDTGELQLYKDPLLPSSPLERILDVHEPVSPTNPEMYSILGHLETDQKRLQAKLEKSPDLAAPITEAQEQLQRLKQLMFSIFASGGEPEMTEVDRQLNLTDTEEEDLDHTLKTTGHGAEEEGGVHPEVDNVTEHGDTTGDVSKLVHQEAGGNMSKYERQVVESTRLDGVEHTTPSHHRNNDFIFSPIVFDTENVSEDDLSGEDERDVSEEERRTEMLDFTKYELSDLTNRLGATGLCYSKDTLLEVSERLRDTDKGAAEAVDMDGTSCREAVDDLEHLMRSLSNLFTHFPPNKPPPLKKSVATKSASLEYGKSASIDIGGEQQGRVLRIVAQINQLLTDNSTKDC